MIEDRKALTILHAEDDTDDQLLVGRVLEGSDRVKTITSVQNGIELLDYLNRRGDYADPGIRHSFPDLILLDLNMPLMDGREVLREIKNTPGLRHIPIVVLTTSSSEMDVNASYDMGVSAYITKPINYHDLERVLTVLVQFWSDVVTLPVSARFR